MLISKIIAALAENKEQAPYQDTQIGQNTKKCLK